jgi:hypothetical protein
MPQKKSTAWVTETTPKATRFWLNSLPLSDSNQTTRELYRSLYTLNRLRLDPRQRSAILEMYRTPVNTVTAALQQNLGQQPLPLAVKLRRMTEIIRELNREMALGYRIVLLDQQDSWKQRLLRKSPAMAVERAMRYLGEVLVHCYHSYLPFPSQLWSELNELYRYSDQNELLDTPVEIDVERDIGATTIKERYKQICLLGLCNPYQLPQGDARKIHIFLYRWANTATVKLVSGTSPAAACFQIDLLRDAPPVLYSQAIDPADQRRVRILDATVLVAKIKSFVERLENGEPASHLDLGTECLDVACLELLRRMLRAWGAVANRQHSRSSGKGFLSLCVGVSATHFFADGQRPFSRPPGSLPLMVNNTGEVADEDPLDIDVDAVDDNISNDLKAKAIAVEDYHVTRWEIVDQSASGLFLRSAELPGMKLRVGDFLGIQFGDDAEGEWWPATVRRMQGDVAGNMEIGIELLASQLVPVAVCAADGQVPCHAALSLPELATSDKKRPRSLVVPRGIFLQMRNRCVSDHSSWWSARVRLSNSILPR